MASGHRWTIVGNDFLGAVTAEYRSGDTLHWPTAIAATACLAGEAALMAHEHHFPERGVMESRKVADFIHDGAVRARTLWGYATTIAQQAYGIEAENLPEYRNIVLRFGMHLQAKGYPPLDTPLHLVPQDTPMNAGPRLRRQIHEIARAEGIQGTDTAFALMTATMKMIGAAQALGPRDLTSLALQSCVAGSRFLPLVEVVSNTALYAIMPEENAENLATKTEKQSETNSLSSLVASVLSTPAAVPTQG